MTKFEKDILAAVKDGFCYIEHLQAELKRRGRSKVDESRIMAARGRLIKEGKLVVSMAGRMMLPEEGEKLATGLRRSK